MLGREVLVASVSLFGAAEVMVPELALKTTSGKDGRWSLSSVPIRKKSYELLITCPGYKSLTLEVSLSPLEPRKTLPSIRLKPRGW